MADNPYVNKVQKSDGSVIMDITDTTAEPSDVAAGEVFYTASGARSVGTGALNIIDDTAGDGDTDKAWSADKLVDVFDTKAPKADPVFTGSISLGRKTNTIEGLSSIAIGSSCEASGGNSQAFGNNAKASAPSAHAEGYYTTASGDNSHAEGFYTTAQRAYQHTSGKYNVLDTTGSTTSNQGKYAEIVGNGTGSSARSNARALDWDGNEYLDGDLYINCNSDSTNGTSVTTALAGKVSSSEKGVANGVASLDSTGKVPSSQLSVIDDTAGDGDTDKTWSADKLVDEFAANDPGNTRVWVGTSDTAAATRDKAVTITGVTEYKTGDVFVITFTNAQDYNGAPRLNINSLGVKTIRRLTGSSAARYQWQAGETLIMVYDGTYMVAVNQGLATTTYYGLTKLYSSCTSTTTASALPTSSLNTYSERMIAGAPLYDAEATYAVGDRVRYSWYIYECNTAITTAEAWNAAHWTQLPALQTQIDSIDNKIGDVGSTDLQTQVATLNGKIGNFKASYFNSHDDGISFVAQSLHFYLIVATSNNSGYYGLFAVQGGNSSAYCMTLKAEGVDIGSSGMTVSFGIASQGVRIHFVVYEYDNSVVV